MSSVAKIHTCHSGYAARKKPRQHNVPLDGVSKHVRRQAKPPGLIPQLMKDKWESSDEDKFNTSVSPTMYEEGGDMPQRSKEDALQYLVKEVESARHDFLRSQFGSSPLGDEPAWSLRPKVSAEDRRELDFDLCPTATNNDVAVPDQLYHV